MLVACVLFCHFTNTLVMSSVSASGLPVTRKEQGELRQRRKHQRGSLPCASNPRAGQTLPGGTPRRCRARPSPPEPPGAPRAGRCGRALPRGPAAGRQRLSARQAPAPRRPPAPSADFYICAPFRSRVTCPAPRPIGSALWSGQWKGRGQWARRLAWRQPMGAGLC